MDKKQFGPIAPSYKSFMGPLSNYYRKIKFKNLNEKLKTILVVRIFRKQGLNRRPVLLRIKRTPLILLLRNKVFACHQTSLIKLPLPRWTLGYDSSSSSSLNGDNVFLLASLCLVMEGKTLRKWDMGH